MISELTVITLKNIIEVKNIKLMINSNIPIMWFEAKEDPNIGNSALIP